MRPLVLLTSTALILCSCGGGDSPDSVRDSSAAVSSGTGDSDHPAIAPIDSEINDPAALEEALDRNPGHTPILMRMAEIALQEGDAPKAVEHLRAVVAAEPENLDARLELGRALYESGDLVSAASETEAIIDRDANHVDALYNLGAIHANQKRPDQAIVYWTQAVAVAPSSPSGQSAQRGLDVLAGRRTLMPEIPDIPEHRGVVRPAAAQPTRLDSSTRDRLIEFATGTAEQ